MAVLQLSLSWLRDLVGDYNVIPKTIHVLYVAGHWNFTTYIVHMTCGANFTNFTKYFEIIYS